MQSRELSCFVRCESDLGHACICNESQCGRLRLLCKALLSCQGRPKDAHRKGQTVRQGWQALMAVVVWRRKRAPCRPQPQCPLTSLIIGLTRSAQVYQPPVMRPLSVPECCAPCILCARGAADFQLGLLCGRSLQSTAGCARAFTACCEPRCVMKSVWHGGWSGVHVPP